MEALSKEEVRALVRGEISTATADRVRWENIAAFEVLDEPFRWAPAPRSRSAEDSSIPQPCALQCCGAVAPHSGGTH